MLRRHSGKNRGRARSSSERLAAITLLGPTPEVHPRVKELGKTLIRHVDSWSHRSVTPREAI